MLITVSKHLNFYSLQAFVLFTQCRGAARTCEEFVVTMSS